MDKKVLNEKIARWLGYKQSNDYKFFICTNNGDYYGDVPPKFTDSMDACIKKIIPEIRKRIYPDYLNIQFGYETENITCGIQGNDCIEIFGYGDTESEAFCLALEKCIDSEGK
jgi:hypothetical protein